MSRQLSVVVAAVCVVAGPIVVRSQTPRPMGIVGLINGPRFADPGLSPDGRFGGYTRGDADWKANRRIAHIWRIGIDGGTPAQLTFGATENRRRAGLRMVARSRSPRSEATTNMRRSICCL